MAPAVSEVQLYFKWVEKRAAGQRSTARRPRRGKHVRLLRSPPPLFRNTSDKNSHSDWRFWGSDCSRRRCVTEETPSDGDLKKCTSELLWMRFKGLGFTDLDLCLSLWWWRLSLLYKRHIIKRWRMDMTYLLCMCVTALTVLMSTGFDTFNAVPVILYHLLAWLAPLV